MADRVIITVPIPKADGIGLEVDVNEFLETAPGISIQQVVLEGIKAIINRGKVVKAATAKGLTGTEKEEAQAALMEAAKENFDKIMEGKVRVTGGKGKAKAANAQERAIRTEAMREARLAVKDAIKRAGRVKVSLVKPKEITHYAEQFLETDAGKQVLAKAKTTVEAMAKHKAPELDISFIEDLKADPALVAKAKEAKEAKKSTGTGVRASHRH